MKSSGFSDQFPAQQQRSESTTSDRRGSRKRRALAASIVATVGLAAGACGTSHSTATPKTPPRHVATRPAPKPPKPEATPTTTTTTVPATESYQNGSGKLVGAIMLVRKGAQETNPADATVVHRLNTGIWENSAGGGQTVDPNPMLDYGPVYNQNTAPFGRLGETSLIAAHDVTPINAPVTLNGTTYDQSEVTHSLNAQPDPSNPNLGVGNMELGDEIIVYVNNSNNTETEYTYTIDNRYIINPNDAAQVQALADPPVSKNVSQLNYYDCWQPYTANYREVFSADLTSTSTIAGNVTYSGSEPPLTSTGIQ